MIIIILLSINKPHPKQILPHSETKPFMKGAYLNYSSTNPLFRGSLNPSDLAYSQNLQLRNDVERIEQKIKSLVNAPIDAKVIINSGATESIANCVFWAKNYNPHGNILGTDYDHSAVKDNCEAYDMPYKTLTGKNIDDRCCGIFLTHVDPKTGRVLNVNNFARNLNLYGFLNESTGDTFPNLASNYILQYKPLLFLDASQSILKAPIQMEKWGLNAVFFSLHKIGAPMGLGVLVIKDTNTNPFKPLINGKQQQGMRGGTLPLQWLTEYEFIFDNYDDRNSRKDIWTKTLNRLKQEGLPVYEPKTEHLYNTFLIATKNCPMTYINELSKKGIYIGNVSACKNEEILNGGDKDNDENNNIWNKAVRISFKDADELTDDVVDEIIKVIKSDE